MPESPRPGATAFVLAGGGTKGSFEVGALQYLVGVEKVAPDIITATSAGALAATVLAQARTLDEFGQRVQEIEDDVLAMTTMGHVFGKQSWLGALDGTRLGREIEHELTEGTRPPFPLTTATGGDWPARHDAGANATSCGCWPEPASACRRCAGNCARAAAPCSTSIPWRRPCGTARTAFGRSTPPSSAGPGCSSGSP